MLRNQGRSAPVPALHAAAQPSPAQRSAAHGAMHSPNFLAYSLAKTVRVKAQPCRPAEKHTVPASGNTWGEREEGGRGGGVVRDDAAQGEHTG